MSTSNIPYLSIWRPILFLEKFYPFSPRPASSALPPKKLIGGVTRGVNKSCAVGAHVEIMLTGEAHAQCHIHCG